MNAKEIIKWVENQKVDTSNSNGVYNFISELQDKIMELDFNLPKEFVLIGYSGILNESNNKTGL